MKRVMAEVTSLIAADDAADAVAHNSETESSKSDVSAQLLCQHHQSHDEEMSSGPLPLPKIHLHVYDNKFSCGLSLAHIYRNFCVNAMPTVFWV